MPDADPIVAITTLLLVHVPPAGVEFNVVVKPVHIEKVGPVIAPGCVFTVTTLVVKQPVFSV